MNDASDTIDDHDEPAVAAEIDANSDTATVTVGGRRAAISGIIAGGVALGIGELLSGLSSKVPSLVRRVGDIVIENVPGSVERWAIENLGTNDKPALVAGIVVVSLLIGAISGIATSKNRRTGAVVFSVFGLIGALATSSDPLRSPGWGWAVAIVSALAGAATLYGLLGTTPMGRTPGAGWAQAGRRNFLGFASTAAVVALGAAVTGTLLRRRQIAAAESGRVEAAQALDGAGSTGGATTASQSNPLATVDTLDNVEGISPLITPNEDFYRIDTALSTPTIDVDTWTMKITGMVDNELEFTFDDLLAMDPVEEFVTLSCVSNRVGGDLVGNAHWLGVPIKKLLDMAGVRPGATQIVGRSVDGWTGGFPTEYLDDPDRVALVAVAMNGSPLPIEHGFPVRLVVAGLYGYVSATKWLKEIELTTLEDFDGYWIPRGWSKIGPVKTQSRIDVPGNARLTTGNQAIAGVAWAPDRGIERVEVLVTPIVNGEPVPSDEWIEAELSGELTTNAWRQWFVPWDAPSGDHLIMVRATDQTGETQTFERTDVAPDGATGWHTIAVRVA